jgi:hypothetical protein
MGDPRLELGTKRLRVFCSTIELVTPKSAAPKLDCRLLLNSRTLY